MDHNSRRVNSLETRIRIVEDRLRRAAHIRLITGILTILAFGLIAGFKELQFQVAFLVLFGAFIWFVRRSVILKKKLNTRQSLIFYYQSRVQLQSRQFEQLQRLKKTHYGALDYKVWRENLETWPQPNAADLNTYGTEGLLELIDCTFSKQGACALLSRLSGVDSSDTVDRCRGRIQDIEKSWAWAKRIKMRVLTPFNYHDILASLPSQSSVSTPQLVALMVLWLAFIFSFTIDITFLKWMRPAFVLFNLYLAQGSHTLFSKLLNVEVQLSNLNSLRSPLKRAVEGLPNSFESQNGSQFFKSLDAIARSTSFLSLASHPILLFLVHLVLPYQPFFSWQADKSIRTFKEKMVALAPELERFEADLSFASVSVFEGVCEPKLSQALAFEKMKHPLMSAETCVANSHTFERNHTMVLTGSNMAGKSTFMRTLGLNQILLQNGAKVFAETFNSPCTQVLTCLQVSDSLRDGTSYFYAELNRIKWILDESQTEQRSLILIDEIFKGTNNKERLIGSEAVVAQLSQSLSYSVVSTHDLELAQIASHMQSVSNHHFRDDIEGDKLSFPYKLLEGASPTTNAVKLMKIRGILKD